MSGRFTTEQLLLIAEDQGWDLDKPLRPQIEGAAEPATPESPAEPRDPEREFAETLAARLAEAQSKWLS